MGETIQPYYSKKGKTKGRQYIDCHCGYPVPVQLDKTTYHCPACGTELKMNASGEEETHV